ncbi:MAG: hypothetical protein JNK82_10920 [Myxococcaceae bacterium]|nr:hypothetical protein [Myxococcaceae bacterium]
MPVNGPAGPVGPPAPLNTGSTQTVSDTAPQQALINTEDVSARPGWSPNRTRGRSIPEGTGPLTSDAIMTAALDRFRGRFESILHADAMSLARGQQPWREGDQLTQQQQRDLVRATTDLLKDTPVSRLSPDLQAAVESSLRSRGIHRDLTNTRLGDLGDAGEELARSFAEQLKDEKPGVFYGVGASAAAMVGYAAWTQGSEGMRRLGVRPEVRTRLFNDHVRVGVGADFDARFQNPRARLSGEVNLPGDGITRPDFRLGANAQLTTSGAIDTLTASASVVGTNYSASALATMRGNQVETIAGSYTYNPSSSFALSAGALWNEPDRRLLIGAEAAWRLSRDAEIAGSISHDSRGDSRIGVGARVRW